jgi:hypothetical protein
MRFERSAGSGKASATRLHGSAEKKAAGPRNNFMAGDVAWFKPPCHGLYRATHASHTGPQPSSHVPVPSDCLLPLPRHLAAYVSGRWACTLKPIYTCARNCNALRLV